MIFPRSSTDLCFATRPRFQTPSGRASGHWLNAYTVRTEIGPRPRVAARAWCTASTYSAADPGPGGGRGNPQVGEQPGISGCDDGLTDLVVVAAGEGTHGGRPTLDEIGGSGKFSNDLTRRAFATQAVRNVVAHSTAKGHATLSKSRISVTIAQLHSLNLSNAAFTTWPPGTDSKPASTTASRTLSGHVLTMRASFWARCTAA